MVSNRKTPTNSTQFPICETAHGFARQVQRGRLSGVYLNAVTAIEQLQPYLSGTNRLLVLSALDNADKHHRLVVTGLIVTQQAITLRDRQTGEEYCQPYTANGAHRDGSMIAAFKADDMDVDVQASTRVAFGDAPARNEEVVPTLAAMTDYIESIVISSLKPWLV